MMGTFTESGVKMKAMEGVYKSRKTRALICGFPTLQQTCCVDHSYVNHRNVNRRNAAPSVRQFPSHVFRESSLIILLIISIFSSYLIRPGNGLHPPQCQWSLYQDIERLNCLVEAGNSLIVEEEVHSIGPESAKSLWVQCGTSDIPPSTSSDSGSSANTNNKIRTDFQQNGDSSYYSSSSSAVGTEGVQQQHQPQHASQTSSNNANSMGFVLSHGVFMAVPNLRDLRLENCKIAGITPGALSYLPYLQNLTLRAHTSLTAWPSLSSLEIKNGVLRGLPELRHLDLSTTSLSSLPNDFLCFLPALQHLNLSSCWLRDFRSIGIVPSDPTSPQNCGNQIKVLDLSANHFTLLPPATFAAVSKLEELRIERNSITIASERALLGLNHLRIISLSGNQLTSLSPDFFKDNRQLQEIYLQNNSLSVLAPGLFADLKSLVVLDLSNNELTSEWVNGDTFRGLDNLFALNLASNFLTKIDSVLFRDLRFLQMLTLENNKISHIAEDAFSGMVNMYTLLLSHNFLKRVDSSICNGLHGLSFLQMNNNNIETIEQDSFQNCSLLQDLNISGNKLTAVPVAISPLTHLRTLDIGENNITDLANASYQSLPNLYGLRLTGNSIKIIPKDSFAFLPSLKIVNIANNKIERVEPGAFDNNPNLQAVRLDSNSISDIAGLFKNIPNLLWLNISGNGLETLNYEDFPLKLQWLDVRSNKIHTLGNCMELQNLRIRNLDLSDNFIKEITSSNLPDSLENIILLRNRLSSIKAYTFYNKKNLTRLVLSHNQLVHLDQDSLRLNPDRVNAPTELFIGHNPLQCDCNMQWIQDMNKDATSAQYPTIQDVEDVKCTLTFDRLYETKSIMSIHPSQFLCKYESHCSNTCFCCLYDACDCKNTCAKNASCFHDQAWTTNLVDYSMLELTYIPVFPMGVTDLYLDGNILTSLDSHSFIARKNLNTLYLNASHIEEIQNKTFNGLKNLKKLHLEMNFLQRLEGFEFEDLENLEELYLQQNSIAWIANETFSSLFRLRVLWLHGNNFVDIPIWQMTTNIGRLGHTLIDMTLRDNEFSCDCQFTQQLRDWLTQNRNVISDANEVQCVDQVSRSSFVPSSGQNKTHTELIVVPLLTKKNHRCSQQSTDLSVLAPEKPSESEEFNLTEYIPWLLLISGIVVLIIIFSVLCYFWRDSLRLCIYSHCGLRCQTMPPNEEAEKLFDCFLSYSSKDEAYVRQVLAQELERHNPPYRLCLRYRDLPGGTGTGSAEAIIQASLASKRIIIVLSQHFLKGEWSRTDVKSAHHSVLKDRHRKVIIILLGDLPSKDLDPDIRLYLKNHIYLNCEDKKFWEKLRYALPDVKVKVPVFRGIHGRTSSRNNSQHLQPHQHTHHHHHHHPQPSPNLGQHMTYLGPNTQNNVSSPLMSPPPVPGLLANLPPNIPNGHHGGIGGPMTTTVIGPGMGNTSTYNNAAQRALQRHPSIVNSGNPNHRQNTAIHI